MIKKVSTQCRSYRCVYAALCSQMALVRDISGQKYYIFLHYYLTSKYLVRFLDPWERNISRCFIHPITLVVLLHIILQLHQSNNFSKNDIRFQILITSSHGCFSTYHNITNENIGKSVKERVPHIAQHYRQKYGIYIRLEKNKIPENK